jgi:tRNA (guanine-N7-)-methyltransferase
MGRRALRKIDPELDLSARLKTIDELPSPWDSVRLFGRNASLEVEVGSGKGLFLRTAAGRRPEVDFLGIEISLKYARFAAAGVVKRNLRNAVVVAGDALRVFADFLPNQSLEAIHVYFPDPWWKKRHKKRRIMRPSAVHDFQRTLKPGGRLHFWSDVEEYFLTTLELLAEETHLEGPFELHEPEAEDDMDYRTHFERRMRLHGQAVYRAEFRKSC